MFFINRETGLKSGLFRKLMSFVYKIDPHAVLMFISGLII